MTQMLSHSNCSPLARFWRWCCLWKACATAVPTCDTCGAPLCCSGVSWQLLGMWLQWFNDDKDSTNDQWLQWFSDYKDSSNDQRLQWFIQWSVTTVIHQMNPVYVEHAVTGDENNDHGFVLFTTNACLPNQLCLHVLCSYSPTPTTSAPSCQTTAL